MTTAPIKPQYYGSIPTIAKAFENDPRTRLAQSMMATGSSTAPVAQGGWAVTDGIARALQGVAGAFVNKRQEKKYAEREQQYTDDLKRQVALALAGGQVADPAQTGATTQGPQANAAPMLPGGSQSPVAAVVPGQEQIPNAARLIDNASAPEMQVPGAGGLPAGGMPPFGGTAAPKSQAISTNAAYVRAVSSGNLYSQGIIPIEGGTDPKTGAFRISPKGAVGPAQLMPGTAPEAAQLAGLPWSEQRYRSDAEYNTALGQAYFEKQLQDFGDPLKAAAAYNAGPGRVRRAVRTAARKGTDWSQHLPEETRDYLVKFTNATQAGAGEPGAQPPQTAVPPPQMEAVPDAPPPPSAEQPQAPGLPGEVQSTNIALAQRLLESGNPDMVAMAQEYLAKGADDQFTARTNRANQEFDQSQTGYRTSLDDWAGQRTDARQAGYTARENAVARNFSRETQGRDQTFTAGENDKNRSFDWRMAGFNRQTARELAQLNNDASWRENQARIEASRASAQEKADAKRTAFFNTATGAKIYEAAAQKINDNNAAIEKFQRFIQLNEKNATGGVLGVPGVSAAAGAVNSDIREMNALANDTTLAAIGGSLGVAISDGDRNFVADSNLSTRAPLSANKNIAAMKMKVLQRANDFEQSRMEAIAQGTQTQFLREWNEYKNDVQLRHKGGYVPFEEWKTSLPQYDASGRRVN